MWQGLKEFHIKRFKDIWLVLKGVLSLYLIVFEIFLIAAIIVKVFETLDL